MEVVRFVRVQDHLVVFSSGGNLQDCLLLVALIASISQHWEILVVDILSACVLWEYCENGTTLLSVEADWF